MLLVATATILPNVRARMNTNVKIPALCRALKSMLAPDVTKNIIKSGADIKSTISNVLSVIRKLKLLINVIPIIMHASNADILKL